MRADVSSLLSIVGAAAGLTALCRDPLVPQDAVIRTKCVQIVGDGNKVLATLDADANGGRLGLMDKDGEGGAAICVLSGGGYLALQSKLGMATCILAADHRGTGGQVVLNANDGRRRVLLSADADTRQSGSISVGRDMEVQATLTADAGGHGCLVFGKGPAAARLAINPATGHYELANQPDQPATKPSGSTGQASRTTR